METVRKGADELRAATMTLPPEFMHLSDVVGDLVQSDVVKAFGPGGTIDSVLDQFSSLGSSIESLYKPLLNVEMFGKKAVKAARAQMNAARGFLQEATRIAVDLMARRDRVRRDLQNLDKEYGNNVAAINKRYDALDKAAEDNLRSIESKWANAIPALERALASATAAFDRENGILQGLIDERDQFLGLRVTKFPPAPADHTLRGMIEYPSAPVREDHAGLDVDVLVHVQASLHRRLTYTDRTSPAPWQSEVDLDFSRESSQQG